MCKNITNKDNFDVFYL